MTDDLDDLSRPPSTDFSIQALAKIEPTANQFPSPSFVANAVIPEIGTGKWRERCSRVADEAPGGVSVHAQQEWDEQVMRVPERLERLLAYPVMGSGVHQHHAKQHDVTGNATGL